MADSLSIGHTIVWLKPVASVQYRSREMKKTKTSLFTMTDLLLLVPACTYSAQGNNCVELVECGIVLLFFFPVCSDLMQNPLIVPVKVLRNHKASSGLSKKCLCYPVL